MIINLDKRQSFAIMSEDSRREYFNKRFRFVSKYPAKCLHCGKRIYVEFTESTIDDIFCPKCRKMYNGARTLVQYQYMKWVKIHQLRVIETTLNENNEKHTAEIEPEIPDYIMEGMYAKPLPFLDAEDIQKRRKIEELRNQYEIDIEIMKRKESQGINTREEVDSLLSDF